MTLLSFIFEVGSIYSTLFLGSFTAHHFIHLITSITRRNVYIQHLIKISLTYIYIYIYIQTLYKLNAHFVSVYPHRQICPLPNFEIWTEIFHPFKGGKTNSTIFLIALMKKILTLFAGFTTVNLVPKIV